MTRSCISGLRNESSNCVAFTSIQRSIWSSTSSCSSSTCSRALPCCGSSGLSSDGALDSRCTRSLFLELLAPWEGSGRSGKSGRSWSRKGAGIYPNHHVSSQVVVASMILTGPNIEESFQKLIYNMAFLLLITW